MHAYSEGETLDYLSIRDQFPIKGLTSFISDYIPSIGKVYDLGCGDGRTTSELPRHKVFGYDASEEMIKIAKTNNPHDHFEVKDMVDVKINNASAVISFFAFFHLHTSKQIVLLDKISNGLINGGMLAMTYLDKSATGHEGVWNGMMDFGGEKFYGHIPLKDVNTHLENVGFETMSDSFEEGLFDLREGISNVEKNNSLIYNITTKGTEFEETLPWIFAMKS